MISTGEQFYSDRTGEVYRILEIRCPTHGALPSCHANVELIDGAPGKAHMMAQCATCFEPVTIAVAVLPPEIAARVKKAIGERPW